jgi:MarR-like DNA-binding transcriptional regulator SgrR of sgrS sRNA
MRGRIGVVLLVTSIPLVARGSLGPRYGQELRVGLRSLPTTLEPRPAESAADRLAEGLVHETLVRVTAEGTPIPSLASSWSIASGGSEWTLALAAGLSFHDGRSLTAEDALRSLRRFARSPSSLAKVFASQLLGGASFRAGTTEELPGLLAPDPLHLVLRLAGPRALPLAPLASPAAAVTSPLGAGAGPFMPTVRIPGRSVAVTSFEGHVRGRPYLDRIVLSQAERALPAELQSGALDLAQGETGLSELSATLLLVLDPSRSPFDRIEARRAVRSVMDTRDLLRLVPGGDPTACLLSPALLPPLPDAPPQEALVLGAQVPLAVSRDVPALVSQRVVALLSSRGVEARVTVLSPEGARESRAGARLLLFSPEVPEAGLALSELLSLSGSLAPSLDLAETELDPDRRRALLERAEGELRREGVLIPLATVPVSFGARRGLHGARVDLSGRLVLEDAWLEP